MTAPRQMVLDWLSAKLAELVGDEGEFEINPSGDPSRFPAVSIEESDQDADDQTEPGSTRYDLSLGIEGYVEGGNGPEVTAARSDLYEAVLAACFDPEGRPDCIEEIREGGMRMATTILAEARRLGFNLTVTFRFVVARPTA